MENNLTSCSNPNVVAIVVTFNRRMLLERVLSRILAQERPVQEIIVVDNNSTDATEEYMTELSKDEPKLTYIRQKQNTGGAGGFYTGVQAALSRNADFLWLMDDDGYPSEACLSHLLYQSYRAQTIFNPMVVNENQQTLLAFGLGENIMTVESANAISRDGLVEKIGNPFNGTLISREILQKVGLPKKEMFIWGDEAEYILRAKKNGVHIATVVDSLFFHPPSKSQYVLFLNRYSIELKPKNLAGNHYRNSAFIKARYHGVKSTIVFIFVHLIYFVSRGNFLEASAFLAYALDGILGTFILPKIRKQRH